MMFQLLAFGIRSWGFFDPYDLLTDGERDG